MCTNCAKIEAYKKLTMTQKIFLYIPISYNSLGQYFFHHIMTTAFSGSSRLANFREKKSSLHEDPLSTNSELKLTLPDKQEKTSYEPSSTFNNTRTSLRLLKGRIERNQSNDKTDLKSNVAHSQTQPKLTFNEPPVDLKLILNDSPQIVEKKTAVEPPMKPSLKRIMIAKEAPKQEPKAVEVKKVEEAKKVEPSKQEKKQEVYVNPHDQKPIIKQEEVEESKQQPEQNQNDLVLCPEGCGRKFNRKALEKHAKACKIVFMSKRKQFNSQAKRVTSKEQTNIAKQNKLKEKKDLGKTKGKGFQKTGDNWKAASEDFRNAIKGVKIEGKEDGDDQQGEEVALKTVACEFCQKLFAEVLMEKHLQNCLKKKEKEKKKVTKKK